MTQKSHDNGSAARVAVMTGTFDPFTLGHASLVERGLGMFDRIIISVGYNRNKAEAALHAGERAAAIASLYGDDPRVEVIADSGLTVDICRRHGARFILRGIRTVADMEYERNMADINREIGGVETVLLFTLPSLAAVSSSMVRELRQFGVDVSRYLP